MYQSIVKTKENLYLKNPYKIRKPQTYVNIRAVFTLQLCMRNAKNCFSELSKSACYVVYDIYTKGYCSLQKILSKYGVKECIFKVYNTYAQHFKYLKYFEVFGINLHFWMTL
jgi:hypothetical protein